MPGLGKIIHTHKHVVWVSKGSDATWGTKHANLGGRRKRVMEDGWPPAIHPLLQTKSATDNLDSEFTIKT